MVIDIEKHFKDDFESLYSSETFLKLPFINRGYAYPNSIKKGSILFVGSNPSYNEQKSEIGSHFYGNGEGSGDIHPYFRKFGFLSDNWSHIDLLGVREVKQNLVSKLCTTQEGLNFVIKHLEISKAILEQSDAKILVVSNTLARCYLGKDVDEKGNNTWMGYNFEFDNEIGTHRIKNKDSNLNETPVFFTSMLTGQRALDNGSFERLRWHIDFVLRKK